IDADDATADDRDLRRCHSGNAAQQYAAADFLVLEVAGSDLDRHASSNLGHWREQWQRAISIRDRLVCYAHNLFLEQMIGEIGNGSEVEVGDEPQPSADDL